MTKGWPSFSWSAAPMMRVTVSTPRPADVLTMMRTGGLGQSGAGSGCARAGEARALPDIATLGALVPGFEASQWVGLSAPKNTPSEIVAKLNTEINAGLAEPRLKARFANLGGAVLPGSPADFGKLIADDTEKWGKVIKFSGAKPE